MLEITRHNQTLDQILAGPRVTPEDRLWAEKIAQALVIFQERPDIALETLSGIISTPHQRWSLYQAHRGASNNVDVSSRGTAKSATKGVLYASYKAALFAKRKIVILSSTGFRGGQYIFEDIEKWLRGGWADQDPNVDFLRACVAKDNKSDNKSLLHRAANYWRLKFQSFSDLMTLPTNDPDRMLGIRATDVFIDEANTFEPFKLVIEKTILPFLNVVADFKHGGAKAKKNAVYYTTTIDYTWREFQEVAQAARAGIARDYHAYQAAQAQDWERFEQLETEGIHQHTYTNFDYTDTIVRRFVTTRDGRRFEVKYPNPHLSFELRKRGVPFTERGPDGLIQKIGSPVEAMRTYPINHDDIERPLFDNSAEESIWMHEQKNVVDHATGDVFPHWLLEQVAGKGEKVAIPYDLCTPEWQGKHAGSKHGYHPTVLYRCTDPVVFAWDYAGGDRDFAAGMVIRVGPMATGDFNPFTQQGYTPWSNVIWAEQSRCMSHRNVRDKLYEWMDRYPNIAYAYLPYEDDDWKLCRGIGLDMRGGGQGVRDSLAYIDDPEPPPGKRRIYDPLDQDPRIQAYKTDPTALPMLDAIWPQDSTNDKCAEFLLAQMKANLLYLPKWFDESQRPVRDVQLDPGYNAAKVLVHQLTKIQQEPTRLHRRFFMPGSDDKKGKDGKGANLEGKKDLFSSFLYAGKQLRAHLIRQAMLDTTPPPMGVIFTQIGKNRGRHGRAIGAKH